MKKLESTKLFKLPSNAADWRPSPKQMEIYTEVCRTGRYCDSATKHRVSTIAVRLLCRRIDEFLSEQSLSEIRELRTRHQMMLEELYAMAIEGFERSKQPETTTEEWSEVVPGDGDSKATERSGKKKRVRENAAGNPAFLNLAKDILADIRLIWAANRKSPDEAPKEGPRIGGLPMLQRLELEIIRVKAAYVACGEQGT